VSFDELTTPVYGRCIEVNNGIRPVSGHFYRVGCLYEAETQPFGDTEKLCFSST
jgi:hypothetical protein